VANETHQAHNTEAERQACEIRLRAERKAGELLKKLNPHKAAGRRNKNSCPEGSNSALKANGISHRQSASWQKLAAIPEQQPKASNRQIAKVLGVHHDTVNRDLGGNPPRADKNANKINAAQTQAGGNPPAVLACAAAAQLVQRKERAEEKRERRRAQQRRHRQRQNEGRRAYLIELDGDIIDMLVRYRWLDRGATADDHKVGCAVRRMLVEAAKAT
jgi:hypothetical protein